MTTLLTLAQGTPEWLTTLKDAGYRCVRPSGELDRLTDPQRFPLAIVDASMPWRSASAAVALLRSHRMPVLLIAGDPASIAHLQRMHPGTECFITGGDPSRLTAFVRTLLKDRDRLIVRGLLRLNTDTHEATLGGRSIPLTAQEFALLQELMLSGEETVSREELLTRAWGYQSIGETRTVDVHVQRLRRKLGQDAIETVYKRGYRLGIA